jgi:hypothetical protein
MYVYNNFLGSIEKQSVSLTLILLIDIKKVICIEVYVESRG